MMKRRKYRNPEVRDRLESGVQKWVESESENSLAQQKFDWSRLWIALFIVPGLWVLTAVLKDRDHSSYFPLWLLLIGQAYWAKSRWFALVRGSLQEEVTYQVPLKRETIAKQATWETMRSLLVDVVIPFSISWILTDSVVAGLKGSLIFLGLIGVIFWTAALPKVWGFTEFCLTMGWAFLLMIGIMWSKAGQFFEDLVNRLPFLHFWEDGPTGWICTGATLLLGIVGVLTFALAKGFFFRVDRQGYYDYMGIATLGGEDGDVIEVVPVREVASESRSRGGPQGSLEKFLWKKFSPEERVIARAAGFCEGHFLRSLVEPCLIFLAIVITIVAIPKPLWQTQWIFMTSLLTGTAFAAIAIAKLVGLRKSPAACFLDPKQLGTSQSSVTPEFFALPVSPRSLRRIILKESLLKWPILAFPVSATLAFVFSRLPIGSFDPFTHTLLLYSAVLGMLALSTVGECINTLLSGVSRTVLPWLKIYGAGGLWVFVGLVTLIAVPFTSMTALFNRGDRWPILLLSIIILISSICIAIGWKIARARIWNPRNDVMK